MEKHHNNPEAGLALPLTVSVDSEQYADFVDSRGVSTSSFGWMMDAIAAIINESDDPALDGIIAPVTVAGQNVWYLIDAHGSELGMNLLLMDQIARVINQS